MTFTELDQADLDSPCRELSIGGLGIVVSLLVRWCVRLLGVQSSCKYCTEPQSNRTST